MKNITVRLLCPDNELLPFYGSLLAAGADVKAALAEPVWLEPGASLLVPTGISVEIPEGYEIQIRPRSGLALKHQITVLNTPGTIDADYRGEIKVILINHGKTPFQIDPKMRIAQIVICRVDQAEFVVVDELGATPRGLAGFGSTGR